MNNKKKCTIAAAIIVLLLLIDQAIKVAVKLNMNIGEEIVVFDWFRISFIENRGMAFGMEIGQQALPKFVPNRCRRWLDVVHLEED